MIIGIDDKSKKILKEIQEWIYIDYNNVEFFICPLCEVIVDVPVDDPKFIHLTTCPFYKDNEVTHVSQ